MPKEIKVIRNAEICRLYEQGYSLRQVAKISMLSLAGIRLIVQRGSKLRAPGDARNKIAV